MPPSLAVSLKHWSIFLFLSVAWGSSYFWIKVALHELTPDQIVAMRVSLASMGLVALAWLARKPMPRDLRTIRQLTVLAHFSIIIPFMLLSWGVSQISSGLTGILNGTVPLFTLLFAHFALPDERLSPRKALGLALGFSGSALLVRSGQATTAAFDAAKSPVWGAFAVLAASACYATGAVYARRRLEHVSPAAKATTVTLIAAVVVWALQALMALSGARPLHLPSLGHTWFALAWLGLIGSCLAYVAYFYLLSAWDATRVSFVMYVAPLVAVILGIFLLGERVDGNLFGGAALVVAGITVANRKRRPHGGIAA